MQLATLKDRTRDGMLVVVSRDLTRCVSARPIAATLQQALDDWDFAAPRLADLAHQLELGSVPAERFHEHDAMSPLPRAFQWLSASLADGERAPKLDRRASDRFLAPREPIPLPLGSRVGCAPEVAVVTGDVAAGASREEAASAVRLVLVANVVVLHDGGAGPSGSAPGSQHASAFSPVAVTPDELGAEEGQVRLMLQVSLNGGAFDKIDTGGAVDFAALIAAAARTRPLAAGTMIGIGPVGASRLLEPGDSIRLEARDAAGHSILGAIEQAIERTG